MKAFVHKGKPGIENTHFTDMEEREPRKGEVKVHIKTAGLNHRDILNLGRRKEDAEPVVLGSDGAGIIVKIGEGVENVKIGDEVIINPSLNWSSKSDAPPLEFEILGVPSNGTFAEFVLIPFENVELKPKHLSWEEAGVLPLAGLTAYRALFTRGKLESNQTVLITGVGGGVATFILLMAKAIGARVIVSSRSEEKMSRAINLGADLAINSNNDWKDELKDEKIDLIVDSVGPATWEKIMDIVKDGGTIVSYGATTGEDIHINLKSFYFGQYNILGTTMGSREEFKEMLQLVEKYQLKPVIDKVFLHSDTINAFKRMHEGEQFGKIALQIG